MEYVERETLATRLKRAEMPVPAALQCAAQRRLGPGSNLFFSARSSRIRRGHSLGVRRTEKHRRLPVR
jgi:hypothetical protein